MSSVRNFHFSYICQGNSLMSKQSEKNVNYNIKTPDTVKIDLLTIIDYKYKEVRDVNITIQQPEFTSVCPMTGLPDFGCITIRYIPNNKIVELKSLKFYMLQYRNVGIFYEHVVNNILSDLVEALNPKWMEIAGNFTARGGITTKVAVEYNT